MTQETRENSTELRAKGQDVQPDGRGPKNQPLEGLQPQPHQYGDNSPSKSKAVTKRNRNSSMSDAWQVVKRLKDQTLAEEHCTHR